ncbi:uncharacterized protein LOC126896437 [Daktulosphaira vitifoliae]|uniref:uncharacterized protein LOC126896437 n=1 Tax=Daktulosphaira vitifoliae TaxID=58002 RepID=UPI0021AA188E|nr:uncharacterized protein LOC126896437 [Daktulosphaira vitifoliae]
MIFQIFILNFYSFWIINQICMVFCSSKLDSSLNIQYVFDVYNIIRQQEGWNSNKSYGFVDNENNYQYFAKEDILAKVEKKNFYIQIPIINKLIIFRYTESLIVFRHLLNIFVQKCYKYRNSNEKMFIYCSKELRKTVSKSNIMFLKLLYVTTLLDTINKSLYNNFQLNVISIVKQIGLLYALTLKNHLDYDDMETANKVVGNARKLVFSTLDNKTLVEIHQISKSTLHHYSNSVKAILLVQYGIDLKRYRNTNTIEEHKEALYLFYNLTVKEEYYDLGFDKLIVDDTKTSIQNKIIGRFKNYKRENEVDNFEEEEDQLPPDSNDGQFNNLN